jgi:outer membrane protein assembly factor BamB
MPAESIDQPGTVQRDTAEYLPRFPIRMTILSALVMTAAVVAQVFVSEIEDTVHVGLDVVMVLTVFTTGCLTVLWLAWILLLSRWRWWKRLVGAAVLILLPFAFLKVFRPVHGGDTNLLRFEPIWTQRRKILTTEVPIETSVDLSIESITDFPRFLGPDQNGIVGNTEQIDSDAFADQSHIVWKQSIGAGWSGFAARNGNAVTMEQRGDQECVTCYEIATGTLKWIYSHPARHRDKMGLGRIGPRTTPTIHKGKVYAVGAVGSLVCLNGTDGAVIWQKDLNVILGIKLGEAVDADGFRIQFEENTTLAWGRSGSPLIVEDMVVVPGGGPDGATRATLLAFDMRTGELKWKGGDAMIAYGSPILATIAGQRQILLTSESDAIGLNPASGEILWRHPRPGESDGGANTSQLSVISETDVLTSKGYPDGGGERIHLEKKNGTLTAESVWSSRKVLKTKLTSPLIHDGYAYSLSNGFMECARLLDGEQMWKRRGRFGHGQALMAGKHILLHSESGELYLEATPDEYREFGTLKTINGVCWNTLCLSGNKLLVRSEIEAACIEIPMTVAPR